MTNIVLFAFGTSAIGALIFAYAVIVFYIAERIAG